MSIVDDVIFDGERSYVRAELRSKATHPRLLGHQIESVDDRVNESVGGGGAGVLGEVGSDLLEVPLGERGQPIGHLRLLGSSRTPARLDPLSELAARGLLVGPTLATSTLIKPCLHIGTKLLTSLIAFLKESECLADNFAGCLVQATLNLFVHKSYELWRERDVHADQASYRG